MAKIYNLTEKLKFGDDPVLVIKDTELTIKSDAEVVLRLLDIVSNRGELAAAREALSLLLSEEDQEKLNALHLKAGDYVKVMQAAAQLALGNDPDEDDTQGE